MMFLLAATLKQREMMFPTQVGSKVFCVQYMYDYFEGGTFTFPTSSSTCMLAAGLEARIIDTDTSLDASLSRPTALVARGSFLTVSNCTITFSNGNDANLQSIGFYIAGSVELINMTIVGKGQIVKYYENTAISIYDVKLDGTHKDIFPHGKYFANNLTADASIIYALTFNILVKQDVSGKTFYSTCAPGTRRTLNGTTPYCDSEFYANMQCYTCTSGFVHGAQLAGEKDELGGCFEPVGVKGGYNCYYSKNSAEQIVIKCGSCSNGKAPANGCK